ncbi:vitamin B12-dependent ribonucleotide reductase [Desulfobaculum bizertense]|uniref:Vitamin B12-dependent ribonucleotide reductase n=1 Tax=Desulfobaculum bizertense DSM 18034 TaxID=1121442 RepID=A0A1T4X157_9BACT|nr:vitamin B12-dependent ribonucleotide reductase [Desulfobaculum bizertense]SKA82858.1 ribonucleoside-diphosphate reductase class II [Desulfobaculum bizertense DSM 18034]
MSIPTMPKDLETVNLNDNAKVVLEKRYYRKDESGNPKETAQELFWRVASVIAAEEDKYSSSPYAKKGTLAHDFYSLMTSYKFLPNSPTLMNAGTSLGQLAACFVLPVGDSMEEIFDAVKNAALIHKSGGGTGFSFSRLRQKDAVVGSTGGVASGPLSFLKIFNTATEQVKQGGTRRGANMGILRVDHPDILEFISAKERDGELNNFNLSVALTERFMQAVEKDEDYELRAPHSGEVIETLSAREVFLLLVNKAWESGDPGIVFIDRINRDNPTPDQGEIESTNPCGEQPLLPYEACNLGSINLAELCSFDKDGCVEVDWNEFERVIRLSVRFLDNVIDASRYPLDSIADTVRKNRKIGLGIMGFADLLYRLRIPYDSQEALGLAEKIMEFMRDVSRAASHDLAIERGPFPAYETSIFPKQNIGPLRNATTTTIAPTGTLSIIAGCSSGVEPLFALSFARYVMDGEKLVEVNPFFEEALKEQGLWSEKLMALIEQKGSIAQIEHLPAELRRVFVTAMDIKPDAHLKMQAAFQKFTDNAVSKTVNLPSEATRQDIFDIYWAAYELGCKGVTVYRDGCKAIQVLCTGDSKPEETKDDSQVVQQRPDVVYGFTQKVETGLGIMYLTVNEVDGKPFEVFATIGKSGRSITAKAEAIGRLVSLALRSGVSVRAIVEQLKGIGGEHPVFRKKGMIMSIPDAIAWVFEQRYLGSDNAVMDHARDITSAVCPECGEPLMFQEGCVLCAACGYTKCG